MRQLKYTVSAFCPRSQLGDIIIIPLAVRGQKTDCNTSQGAQLHTVSERSLLNRMEAMLEREIGPHKSTVLHTTMSFPESTTFVVRCTILNVTEDQKCILASFSAL